MDNTRFFLYAALTLVAFMLWQAWQQDYGPQREPSRTERPADDKASANDAPRDLPATATDDLPALSAGTTDAHPAATPQPDASGTVLHSDERIHVRTDVFAIEIDTMGGDIRSLDLLDYALEKDKPETPFPLLSDRLPAMFVVQGGLISGAEQGPTHHARWRAERTRYVLGAEATELRVPLYYEDETGLRVTKTYVFRPGDYEIGVEFRVDNGTDATWRGNPYLQMQRTAVLPAEPSWFVYTFLGAAVHNGEKYRKIQFDDLIGQPVSEDHQGGWAAMVQHYFIGAMIPPQDALNHYYSLVLDGARYSIGTRMAPIQVEAGGSALAESRLFLGPKLQDRLAAVAHGLDRTVDYGWLTFLAQPLFWLLDKIHAVTGNWGWSIIFLTILIKLAFYKLSETSYRSMANMRKVQPRLKAIQERYKDDRQRLNQAMMDLYKTEKINPLGGCLPILVQIPVFIALYWVLLESVELRQAPWALWIDDLSSRDPFFVLPLLMGASMFLQQKLNPAPLDPVQQKVMTVLPVVFTVFFAFFPSGLVLYWLVNNVISLAQQAYITRKIEAGGK